MDKDVLERMDKLIERAGTSDPEELASFLHAHIIPLHGSVIGYVRWYKADIHIGVHSRLGPRKRKVMVMHEVTHIECHIGKKDFAHEHQEAPTFAPGRGIYDKTIFHQEKEANLAAADFTIPTGEILDVMGYNNPSLRAYRECLNTLRKLRYDYDNFRYTLPDLSALSKRQQDWLHNQRHRMDRLYAELQKNRDEFTSSDYCTNVLEIASTLRINSIMVEYKLEALRLRGYKIDPMELARYDNVFRGWV